MALQHATSRIAGRPAVLRRKRGFFLDSLISLWRSRQALKNLDSGRLDDIGVSRDEAKREAMRLIWDVPQNWRR